MRRRKKTFEATATAFGRGSVCFAVLAFSACTIARQVPDDEFRHPIESPRYTAGSGPRVAIDAGHGNFHTADERFGPFARLLRDDGYTVESIDVALSSEALAEVDVLAIANPLAKENLSRWRLPTRGAFSDIEIATLRRWIEDGGALLLIADHMPFPGAAESLAADLGVFFANGYARDGSGQGRHSSEIMYTITNVVLQLALVGEVSHANIILHEKP